MKSRAKTEIISEEEKDLILVSQRLANKALTIATLVLVVVNIIFSLPYAPFIILLMSSRIISSVYRVMKMPSKKAIAWLVVWVALMAKSIQSYVVFLAAI